jgi:hypothetical protein
VLDATVDALVAQGIDRVSIADIAANAGVHETSINRRWGTRETLIIDALFARTEHDLPIPDTGSLRGDLIAAARSLAELLSSPIGALIAGASALTVNDPDLAATRDRYWASRFAFADTIVRRAIERGELPPASNRARQWTCWPGPCICGQCSPTNLSSRICPSAWPTWCYSGCTDRLRDSRALLRANTFRIVLGIRILVAVTGVPAALRGTSLRSPA